MFEKIQMFWEDQHPFVRSNFNMGLSVLLFSLILRVAILGAVRILSQERIFTLVFLVQVLQTIFLLLLVLGIYNALRLIWQVSRGHGVATIQGILLAWVGVILIIVTLLNMPHVLDAAIAQDSGRPYHEIYTEIEQHCQRWVDEWGDEEIIRLDVNQEEFGSLRDVARINRVGNSVIFNFSESDRDFGLICVLDHSEPTEPGQARYTFYRESNLIYQFLEDASQN